MTTIEATAPSAGAGRPERSPGTITIAEPVVSKIAAWAAAEVSQAGGAAPRVLGRAFPGAGHLGIRASSLATIPHVVAEVDGSVAFIDMSISIRWPASVPRVTAEVRDRVTSRVRELTGLSIARFRITVTALVTDEPAARVR